MSPQGASLAAHINAIRQIRVTVRELNTGLVGSVPFVCVDCGRQFASVMVRPVCPRCESDDVRVL